LQLCWDQKVTFDEKCVREATHKPTIEKSAKKEVKKEKKSSLKKRSIPSDSQSSAGPPTKKQNLTKGAKLEPSRHEPMIKVCVNRILSVHFVYGMNGMCVCVVVFNAHALDAFFPLALPFLHIHVLFLGLYSVHFLHTSI
jgi:hypothetical protein